MSLQAGVDVSLPAGEVHIDFLDRENTETSGWEPEYDSIANVAHATEVQLDIGPAVTVAHSSNCLVAYWTCPVASERDLVSRTTSSSVVRNRIAPKRFVLALAGQNQATLSTAPKALRASSMCPSSSSASLPLRLSGG
ncbi:hypothetical protein CC79DRAFT_6480 [Sarocladium strictum]